MLAKNTSSSMGLRIASMAAMILFMLMPDLAFANLSGGLSEATSMLNTIKTWLYATAGVAAVIYLLFKALQAWQGRCEWGEFGMAVFYVALAGAAVTLANWAFSVFA